MKYEELHDSVEVLKISLLKTVSLEVSLWHQAARGSHASCMGSHRCAYKNISSPKQQNRYPIK